MNLSPILRTPFHLFFVFYFAFSPSYFAAAPAAGDLHTFYGIVKAVDPAGKTITLKSSGKSFVFLVTNETKISGRYGAANLDKIRSGYGAAIVMRVGADGHGIALTIRFDPTAGVTSALYSLKTTRGEIVSGMAFYGYVVEQPPSEAWSTTLTYEKPLRGSMFLLSVNPDGTVADAKPLRTLGYPDLDARAVKWLKRWKFRPNSVAEARIPMGYQQTR